MKSMIACAAAIVIASAAALASTAASARTKGYSSSGQTNPSVNTKSTKPMINSTFKIRCYRGRGRGPNGETVIVARCG